VRQKTPAAAANRGTYFFGPTLSEGVRFHLNLGGFMAQTVKAKDRSSSRGRARQSTRRSKIKTDRVSRDTRSRSRANDERKAKRRGNPRARRSPATTAALVRRGVLQQETPQPKNARERAIKKTEKAGEKNRSTA
jgi:hypothetical protein